MELRIINPYHLLCTYFFDILPLNILVTPSLWTLLLYFICPKHTPKIPGMSIPNSWEFFYGECGSYVLFWVVDVSVWWEFSPATSFILLVRSLYSQTMDTFRTSVFLHWTLQNGRRNVHPAAYLRLFVAATRIAQAHLYYLSNFLRTVWDYQFFGFDA